MDPTPGQTEQSSALANEPAAPSSTQIPVSEIPSEVKSLEELSGTRESANEIIQETSSLPPEMQPTSAPAEIHTTDDSRAKIIKIVVPIVVAIALGLGGYLVYSFFIKGDTEDTAPTEKSTTEEPSTSEVGDQGAGITGEESTIEEQELEQSLNEAAEKAAKEASEGAPTGLNEETVPEAPAEETTPEEETPKVKVPRFSVPAGINIMN